LYDEISSRADKGEPFRIACALRVLGLGDIPDSSCDGVPCAVRIHILRTLLHKEVLRHLANRGGLALALLLVVAAMLLAFFGKGGSTAGLTGDVARCYVDYWEESPWIEHLRQNRPAGLENTVVIRHVSQAPTRGGNLVYPSAAGAIQIHPEARETPGRYRVMFWHPGPDGGLAGYEAWFWKETHRHFREAAPERVPVVAEERHQLKGGLDPRSAVAASLVLFALFFTCVYLLPSLTCEERERGVLLAQALSPASPAEILTAKFLFYPVGGVFLAALIAGIYRPAVLASGFFWLALVVASLGSLGIGMVIASLARTQRAASMGALCYMASVALILFICQQNNIAPVSALALEYHVPRMLNAALADAVIFESWLTLGAATVLSAVWLFAAAKLFRRCGWQ
jgi:hypothetical protein